jgi:hypothetical protein
MEKPQVDYIGGLSPAIAIEQKTVSKNPRSTVGTVTEIVDYLRVLYARVGTPHCPQCGRPVQPQSAHQITNQLLNLKPGTRFQLLAHIVRGRKGTHADRLAQAHKSGYTRARIDGELLDLAEARKQKLDKNKKHTIELIVDRAALTLRRVYARQGLFAGDGMRAGVGVFGESCGLTVSPARVLPLRFNQPPMASGLPLFGVGEVLPSARTANSTDCARKSTGYVRYAAPIAMATLRMGTCLRRKSDCRGP